MSVSFSFSETERRIRANNREFNSQFNYAVRSKYGPVIPFFHAVIEARENSTDNDETRFIFVFLFRLSCRTTTSRRPSIRF